MATKGFSAKQDTEARFAQKSLPPEEVTARIRKVAQDIYVKRGSTSGHELEDWLTAERQVKKELRIS